MLDGGFKYVLFILFSPLLGKDEPILTFAYFSQGLVKNHQLEMIPGMKWQRQ